MKYLALVAALSLSGCCGTNNAPALSPVTVTPGPAPVAAAPVKAPCAEATATAICCCSGRYSKLLARDSSPVWEKISRTGPTQSVGSCPAEVSASEITR